MITKINTVSIISIFFFLHHNSKNGFHKPVSYQWEEYTALNR